MRVEPLTAISQPRDLLAQFTACCRSQVLVQDQAVSDAMNSCPGAGHLPLAFAKPAVLES